MYESHRACLSCYIRGESAGMVSILGRDNIDPCEKESSCEQLSNSDRLASWSCLNLQIHKHREW